MEVLVALLVVAVGVVGLTRFQGVFLRDTNSAKARAVASSLAREKLDDLKSFSQLGSGGNGVFGYAEIGNNTGGSETANGTLRLATGTVAVSNTSYSRSWTATPRYYCGNNSSPTTANCAGGAAKARPDFLALKVTVGWTDQDGAVQSVVLDDVIPAIDPSSVASALISGASPSSPIVPYVPGLAPNVLAIDIGGGQKKETTNPTPTLNKKGQAVINTIARYETIRFSATTNTITREEFTTLNCRCTQLGVSTVTNPGYNRQGVKVVKKIGEPSDRDQAAECSVCCRDHHDDQTCDPTTSAGKKNCYDPLRPTGDYTTGDYKDHNHYNANGQLANNVGDTYREACRMRRTDGDLRVDQDWHLATLSLIPESFFAVNGTPNTSNLTLYSSYVKDYVAATLKGTALPAKPWPLTSEVNKGASAPYSARGIYIDYIDDITKEAYKTRIDSSDQTIFQEIPFYEVNMTKLAQWSSTDPSKVFVSNDQLVTEQVGQNLYRRGVAAGRDFGISDLRVAATAGNAGVINEFISSDPDDGSIIVDDYHEVTVPGTNPTIVGTVSPSIPALGAVFTASNGGSCTYSGTAYSCSVPYNWTGTVTPSAPGYVFTPPSRSYAGVIINSSGQNYTTVTSTLTYTLSGQITPAIASVSFANSTTGASCVYDVVGSYVCTVPEHWTGDIVPSASGYSFAPARYAYTDVVSSQTGQNFTATVVNTLYTITGAFSPAPAAASFTVSTGGSCSYDGSTTGTYSCTVPSGWTGSITPTVANARLTPASRNYSNVSSNTTGQNFAVEPLTYLISGQVAPNATGVSVTTTNGGGTCSYSVGTPNGSYTCTVPNAWSGSVTPTAAGKVFTPSSRSYSNVTSDQLTENYNVTDGTAVTFTVSGAITITGTSRFNPTIAGTNGASCAVQSRNNPTQCTTSCSYSCSVTIASGATWNGTITPGSTGNGRKTFTPTNRSYSGVTTSQIQNFSCSGAGC